MTTPTAAAYSMLAVPEAQRIVLAHTPVLDAVDVGLQEALGSVLAEDVVAKEPLPPFPASIKDGYAVVASDGPGWYPVVGDVRAGNADEIDVQPGSVAYITTGAPIPKGADAVVMVEKTQLVETSESPTGKSVRIDATATPGLDIRPVGCDITSGQVVLSKGEMVGVAEVGLLATVGATEVRATRRPVVAVMSTGDELVEPAVVQLGKGQIRDSNRVMLLAAAASAGAQVHDLGIAGDEEQRISSCLARAVDLQADVVISSGGVSMGDKDLVKALLERSGTVHFGKVKMKPGKPLTFATMEEAGRRILFFGLPGNPVSSLVTFNLAVRPCLDKMRGCPQPELRRIHARTSTDLRLDPERPEYHRATARWESLPETEQGDTKGEFRAVTTGIQASSRLLSARSANVLLELPQGSGVIPAGTVVSALVIDDLRGMPNSET